MRGVVVVALVAFAGWVLLPLRTEPSAPVDNGQAAEPQPTAQGEAGASAPVGAGGDVARLLGLHFAFDDGQPVAAMELTDADGRTFRTDATGSVGVHAHGRYTVRMGAVEGVVDVRPTGGSYTVPRVGVCRIVHSGGPANPLRLRAGATSLSQMLDGAESPVRIRTTTNTRLGADEQPQLVLPYGDWQLTIGGDRWRVVPSGIRVDAPQADVTVQLLESQRTSLGLRVLDESMSPMAGIEVRSRQIKDTVGRTDADGRLVVDRAAFSMIEHPIFDIAVDGAECQPRLRVGPFAWGTEENVVTVHRRRDAWLRLVEAGAEVADLGWVATLHRSDAMFDDMRPHLLLPEPPGRSRLPPTHAATDWVLCRRGASAVLARTDELARSDSRGVDYFDLTWPAETALDVLVLDGSGRPVPGATAHLVLACDREQAMQCGPIVDSDWFPGNALARSTVLSIARGISDATGRAVLRGPINGHTYVRVDGPSGFAPATTTIGGPSITIVLQGAGTLRGAIRGMPVEKRGSGPFYEQAQWFLAVNPVDGTEVIVSPWCHLKGSEYRVEGLRHGEFQLKLRKQRMGTVNTWDLGRVRIDGEVVRDLELADLPMHSMSLTVEGLEQFPGAMINVYRRSDFVPALCIQNQVVREGRLELSLSPGTYSLRARLLAGRDGRQQQIECDAPFECSGTGSDRVRFVVEPGEIRLVTRSGDPAATQWFMIRTQAGFLGVVQTDADGVAYFDTWPSQKFELQRATFSQSRSWEGTGPRVAITRGQTSAVVD